MNYAEQRRSLLEKFGRGALEAAAARFGADVPSVMAVAAVEAAGDGMIEVRGSMRPKILFERHHFAKYTGGRFNVSHPNISGPYVAGNNGYYGGAREWERFSTAFGLDKQAAMKATSWGTFQVLGAHATALGYSSVDEFVDKMKSGYPAHLDAFARFVDVNRLGGFLRLRDWAKFARGYNGPGYMVNRYDVKMAQAYAAFLQMEAQG